MDYYEAMKNKGITSSEYSSPTLTNKKELETKLQKLIKDTNKN